MDCLGSAVLGQYSFALSFIMFLTILGQFVNNQAIQVEMIKSESNYCISILASLFALFVMYSLFVVGLLLIFGQYIQSYFISDSDTALLTVVAFSVPITLINSIFELGFVSVSRLGVFYTSIAFSALVSVGFVVIAVFINRPSLVLWLPLVSAMSSLLFYMMMSVSNISKSLAWYKYINFSNVYTLVRSTWYMNLIPFLSVSGDFLLKFVFMATAGSSSLGKYQLLVSVEAMVGNVILGPVLKKYLVKYSILKKSIAQSLDKDIAKVVLLSCLPIVGLFIIYILQLFIEVESASLELLLPLIFLSVIRIAWSAWGVVAQVLLSQGFSKFVTVVEIMNRQAVMLVFIVLLYVNDAGYLNYITSVTILFIPVVLVTLKARIRLLSHSSGVITTNNY